MARIFIISINWAAVLHSATADQIDNVMWILLADISMPGPSGIELAAELRHRVPATRVLILSLHEGQSMVNEAMSAGAAGYVTKRAVEHELIRAIRTVSDGGTYLAPGLQARAPVKESVPAGSQTLTEGELNILRALAGGMTMQDTACSLQLSRGAVEEQRAALLNKLGLRHRVDLVTYARLHTLLA